MRGLLLLSLLALAAPGRENPDPKEPQTLQDQLQGEWTVEKVIRGGAEVPPKEKIGAFRFVFAGTDFTMIEPKARFGKGTFSVDAKKKPPQVDLRLDDKMGGTFVLECIVEIKGDQMKLCYDQGGERPTGIESPAKTDIRVLHLKRVKK